MKQINDSIFGEMTYDYGWRKTEIIDGKEYVIVAKAYKNDEINDNHRELYKYLKNNFTEINKIIEQKMKKYIKETYSKEYKQELFFNRRIILNKRKKEIGFVYDTKLDVENGLGIKLADGNYTIGFQNITL